MKIPPGKTEREVLAAITRAADILAPGFVFGTYAEDDIRQEMFVFALEVLEKEKYDPARPFENFIYSHLKNRLINLKRNKWRRSDAPCKPCHAGMTCGDADGTGTCAAYDAWTRRNRAKSNLMRPLDLGNISDENERRAKVGSTAQNDAEIDEALEKIDWALPIDLRSTYLQMRDGVSVPKAKRDIVEAAVLAILGGGEAAPLSDPDPEDTDHA